MTQRKVMVETAGTFSTQAPARRRIAQTTDLGNNGPYGGINRMDVIQGIATASLSAGPDRAVAECAASALRAEGIAAMPVRLTTTKGIAYACLYRAPDSYKWNVVDKGHVHDTQAVSVQNALELVHPWLWSYQELVDGSVFDEVAGAE